MDWIDGADELPVSCQCALAEVSRATVYRRLRLEERCEVERAEDLLLCRLIDEEYTMRPFYGSRRMVVILRGAGHVVNRKRVQRLMRKMGLAGMAPGPATSRKHPRHKVYPYLLRGVAVTRPNQVWSADIVCTQMTKTDVFAARVGGNHISDLDFGICHDHPVDQQFDQLALLLEASVGQSGSNAGAEVINTHGESGNLFMVFGLGRELLGLFCQRLVSLIQFPAATLVLG